MKPLVLIYARVPRYGRVKTRLARDIGKQAALHFYRTHLSALIRRLKADARFETRLAFASARDLREGKPEELSSCAFEIQTDGDLGKRMASSLDRPRPTLIVGSDIPDVSANHIWKAFKALGHSDAVFGPAPDGGYWLIGCKNIKHQPRHFLQHVRWSTQHTLSDTVATLPKGWSISYIDVLEDVDDGMSHGKWRARRNGREIRRQM